MTWAERERQGGGRKDEGWEGDRGRERRKEEGCVMVVGAACQKGGCGKWEKCGINK